MDTNALVSEIRHELMGVVDPDLDLTFEELDAIRNIEVNNGLIKIVLELVQPINMVAEQINDTCVKVLQNIAPDYENEIIFSEKPIDLSDREVLKGVKNIVAVASGKGGVGKSAISSNLAAALAMTGARVGILDGDVYGPSQPTMFNLKDKTLQGVEENGKIVAFPHENYGVKVASMGMMMSKDQAAIVRGPMLAGYFTTLFEQVEWGVLDFLIFDLPPGTGDIQLTMTQRIPLTGAVVVTTPQEISLADVRRSISMFDKVDVPVLGIVENMSYFVPPDMPDKKYYVFGKEGGKEIAKEKDIPLLGQVPLNIDMRESNDNGMPVVLSESKETELQRQVLMEVAKNLSKEIRKRNYEQYVSGDIDISI
jgi:ATP-binding protein involved in chromosome partitioning